MMVQNYLEAIFDEKIVVEGFSNYKELPLFLQNEYEFYQCKLHGLDCVLLKLKSERILIDKLKKHLLKLKEFGNGKLILVFDHLRAQQRKKLVGARISFIVPNRQIYLPFICLDFNEKSDSVTLEFAEFNVTTQLVFLSLLLSKQREVQTKSISNNLGIAYASANRAIRQLVSAGLIIESGLNTRKTYYRLDKKVLWEKGKGFLMNPVLHVLFLSELPSDLSIYESEDTALAEITMLADPRVKTYAISKSNSKEIEKRLIQKAYDLVDDSYYRIEVWKYDPGIFADGNHVDIFSLYAQYIDQDDPRVEIALEDLLEEALC
jgi:predicted transcriptional regulator